MAGIIHKIEEKFKGGKKEGEKHDEFKGEGRAARYIKPEHRYGEHKPEQKAGFIDKIKGGGKENKKKKERKNKGHGHDHGDSSSSSDSD